MKKKFKIIDTSTGQKLEPKKKALDILIQKVLVGTASEQDSIIYNKLKKMGVIK